jgi:hypothetical protein
VGFSSGPSAAACHACCRSNSKRGEAVEHHVKAMSQLPGQPISEIRHARFSARSLAYPAIQRLGVSEVRREYPEHVSADAKRTHSCRLDVLVAFSLPEIRLPGLAPFFRSPVRGGSMSEWSGEPGLGIRTAEEALVSQFCVSAQYTYHWENRPLNDKLWHDSEPHWLIQQAAAACVSSSLAVRSDLLAIEITGTSDTGPGTASECEL